jgi:hypothetical protein
MKTLDTARCRLFWVAFMLRFANKPITLSVVTLNVVILSVVVPFRAAFTVVSFLVIMLAILCCDFSPQWPVP